MPSSLKAALQAAARCCAGISVLAAALVPTSVAAQQEGVVRNTFEQWRVICDTPPGAPSEQCVLLQSVLADDAEIGLTVIALRTADGETELLRVLVPLGVLLPNGLGLRVDGQTIGNAQYMSCLNDGCYAQVVLDDTLKDTLRNGETATFIVYRTPEEGIGVPIDLAGFAEGYAALR